MMGEIRHLMRQWWCGRKGHAETELGPGGLYCSRCYKPLYTWEEWREALRQAVERSSMMMVGALEEVSKALRDIKARQDQAEEEEQANIEKARKKLGGE